MEANAHANAAVEEVQARCDRQEEEVSQPTKALADAQMDAAAGAGQRDRLQVNAGDLQDRMSHQTKFLRESEAQRARLTFGRKDRVDETSRLKERIQGLESDGLKHQSLLDALFGKAEGFKRLKEQIKDLEDNYRLATTALKELLTAKKVELDFARAKESSASTGQESLRTLNTTLQDNLRASINASWLIGSEVAKLRQNLIEQDVQIFEEVGVQLKLREEIRLLKGELLDTKADLANEEIDKKHYLDVGQQVGRERDA